MNVFKSFSKGFCFSVFILLFLSCFRGVAAEAGVNGDDAARLAGIAVKSGCRVERFEAVEKLTDQKHLSRAALESKDSTVRFIAVSKLTVRDALARVAGSDNIPAIRFIANSRLPEGYLPAGEKEQVLYEPLEDIPASAALEGKDADAATVSGRKGESGALYLEDCSLRWDVLLEGNYFIEFWMRPSGWDALSGKDVEIARLNAREGKYELYLCGTKRQLVMETGGEAFLMFPAYNWVEKDWMREKREEEMWNYLNIEFRDGKIALSVNGFYAPGEGTGEVTVEEFMLSGSEGTVFSDLRIFRGSLLGSKALRERYLRLHRGEEVFAGNGGY